MTNLFIIILNFNSQKDIIPCFKSLIKAYPKIKIIIVDNSSTDGSIKILKKLQAQYLELRTIFNKKNFGFAKAINKGIKLAIKQGAEAVLLLNPDTLPDRGFLEPLLANPADVVGPIIKFKRNGEWVYDFGGKVNWWIGRTTHREMDNREWIISKLVFLRRSLIKMENFPAKRDLASPEKPIDYVSGCAMLIRRQVFKKIGFLNEKYFLFFEDADFCLRAKKAGFKVALETKSIIFHKLSEGKAKSLKQMYHLIRSNLIFVNTWLPFYRRPIAYFYLSALSFKMLLNRI